MTGLSVPSIQKARQSLGKHKLLCAKLVSGNVYRYSIPDPSTGEPLPEHTFYSADTSKPEVQHPGGLSLHERTPEQYHAYYSHRLGAHEGKQWNICCPFHDDRKPSLSVNTEKGIWNCFGCGKHGGVLAFEMAFSKSDKDTALTNIGRIMGVNLRSSRAGQSDEEPEASYHYCDEHGNLLFCVHRFTGKRFSAFWLKKRKRKVLYRLPQVIDADTVIVCEGEKDADRVHALNLRDINGRPVAVTCNPFGAGNWLEEFSPFLKDKRVVVLADSDEKGFNHACNVVDSVDSCALETKLVRFDESGAKDVSDYLDRHSAQELVERMGADWFSIPDVEPALEPPLVPSAEQCEFQI